MLRELHISNLAIIEDVQVELDGALTVFTGQTGAGKSLVVGALQLLLGTRPAGGIVRAGAKEGRVSGVFVVSDAKVRAELARLADVTLDDEEVLITRRLQPKGRGACAINGQPVTVAMLQAAGEYLVDIHGQYDHQYLLRPANQLAVLDGFAGCEALRDRVSDAYRAWQDGLARRDALAENAELRRQQLELYEFQAGEIDEADAQSGELDVLAARHRRLANIERIRQVASAAHASMDEDGGLLDGLRSLVRDLNDLAKLDAELRAVVEPCDSAALGLEEAGNDLRRYVDALDFDPAELEQVDARLGLLHRLCDKYGGGIDALLAHRRKIETEVADLRRQQDDFAKVDAEIDAAQKRFDKESRAISAKRRSAGKKLATNVKKQLAELGMERAGFEVQLTACEPGPTGCDQIEMMAQTNPGQPAHPLRKTASGGELSRVMLALKSILAGADRVSVLVFDEVDAHVGGRLGSVIGEKLRGLARKHQVICITHLPQIAAHATRQLKVAKTTRAGQTRTEVRPVTGQDRIEELAEMIAGPDKTPTSRRQARELIKRATNEGGKGS